MNSLPGKMAIILRYRDEKHLDMILQIKQLWLKNILRLSYNVDNNNMIPLGRYTRIFRYLLVFKVMPATKSQSV